MEFSVKKYDLLGALNLTQGVVERKTTIPILSHLLCEAKGNSVTLTATDLELSIRTTIIYNFCCGRPCLLLWLQLL